MAVPSREATVPGYTWSPVAPTSYMVHTRWQLIVTLTKKPSDRASRHREDSGTYVRVGLRNELKIYPGKLILKCIRGCGGDFFASNQSLDSNWSVHLNDLASLSLTHVTSSELRPFFS